MLDCFLSSNNVLSIYFSSMPFLIESINLCDSTLIWHNPKILIRLRLVFVKMLAQENTLSLIEFFVQPFNLVQSLRSCLISKSRKTTLCVCQLFSQIRHWDKAAMQPVAQRNVFCPAGKKQCPHLGCIYLKPTLIGNPVVWTNAVTVWHMHSYRLGRFLVCANAEALNFPLLETYADSSKTNTI